MYSKHHAAISFVVSAALAYALGPFSIGGIVVPAPLIVLYGTALGVLIDLDHLVIARARTGTWDAVRFCLRHPRAAVADQSRIFDRGDVGVLPRLVSHLVIVGVVIPTTFLASVPLGILTAAVLYLHLLADVVWNVYQARRHRHLPAREQLRRIV
ncbi:hypothetical protein ACFQGT_04100 [Natrialbaceae archaeon GCM10025810]|uniref:hypothetical protein n=1 Tax=Halovalidus salilacus TaxID=3075124 RepID=UPI0036202E7F